MGGQSPGGTRRAEGNKAANFLPRDHGPLGGMSKRGSPPPVRPPLIRRPRRPSLRDNLRPLGKAASARTQRRRRLLAGLFTGAAQLALFGVLLWPYVTAQAPEEKSAAPSLEISFVDLPKPAGPPDQSEPAAGAPAIAPPPVPDAAAPTITIARTAVSDTSDLLSAAQIAGAARAGEGGAGGGSCDMARAVQQALRRDPLVRTAVAGAGRLGQASMLWNGDWVRVGGQEGKGLAAVRQAVLWEVGFAPANCRNERVHGLVLLSLADGRTRFAIGTNEWRWADLLGINRAAIR
jgi:hypothetical protein